MTSKIRQLKLHQINKELDVIFYKLCREYYKDKTEAEANQEQEEYNNYQFGNNNNLDENQIKLYDIFEYFFDVEEPTRDINIELQIEAKEESIRNLKQLIQN